MPLVCCRSLTKERNISILVTSRSACNKINNILINNKRTRTNLPQHKIRRKPINCSHFFFTQAVRDLVCIQDIQTVHPVPSAGKGNGCECEWCLSPQRRQKKKTVHPVALPWVERTLPKIYNDMKLRPHLKDFQG